MCKEVEQKVKYIQLQITNKVLKLCLFLHEKLEDCDHLKNSDSDKQKLEMCLFCIFKGERDTWESVTTIKLADEDRETGGPKCDSSTHSSLKLATLCSHLSTAC